MSSFNYVPFHNGEDSFPYVEITHPYVSEMEDFYTVPNSTGTQRRLSAYSGWKDYLVYQMDGFQEKMKYMDGFYMDEVQPIPDSSATSGGGYESIEGGRRVTWEFRYTREIFQRSAYNLYQRNGERPSIIAHNSSTNMTNSLSSADMFLTGEQFYMAYFSSNPELKPPLIENDPYIILQMER